MIKEFLLTELAKKNGRRKDSLPQLARKTGVSNTTLHNWLWKNTGPPLDKAERVLNALGYELIIRKIEK